MIIWFHFDNGSNPYGVKTDLELFKMIIAWNVTMTTTKSFQCHSETPAYYKPTDYNFKKNGLREFAKEYQRGSSELSMSYEDLAFWGAFFGKYGKKYGLLTEFHENGIC